MNQPILALLTGRGNNTFANKNISLIQGSPALSYPAKAAKKSERCNMFYASSDSDRILELAAEYGFSKIKRPDHLATPSSLHLDVIIHALEFISISQSIPDIVVVLLANSITIKSSWIDECIDLIIADPDCSAVVPVIQDNDHHPYRSKKINQDGYLSPFMALDDSISSNRQDLIPAYFLAHNFWVLRSDIVLNQAHHGPNPWPFMGTNVLPFAVNEAFDIHTPEDIVRSENWLNANEI